MLSHKWKSIKKIFLSPFHLAFLMLRLDGYWPSEKWKNYQINIYFLYTILSVGIVSSFLCSEIIYILFIRENINSSLECCIMLFSVIDLCIKAISILQHREKYRELVSTIINDNRKVQSFTSEKILKNYHHEYLILCYSAIIASLIFFTSIIVFSIVRNTLPIKIWIPYLKINTSIYTLAYGYTCISLLSVIMSLLSYNLIAAGIAVKICAELDILQYHIKNITGKNKNMRYIEFSKLIQRHIFIIKLATDHQNITYAPHTSQSLILVGNLCIGVLLFIRVSVLSFDFLLYLDFTTTLIIPSILYYWYSDRITRKSLNIGSAVYEIDWFNYDKSEIMTIINIMRYSRERPIVFRTNLRSPMNLHTFAHMIHISYKVFTFLNTITVKNF